MSSPWNTEQLTQLKQFVSVCESNSNLLYHPDLEFFKRYIEKLGGRIPPVNAKTFTPPEAHTEPQPEPAAPPHMDDGQKVDSDLESDLEFDMEGCVEPDVVSDAQVMPPVPEEEIAEADMDQADEKRREAMGQFSEGNFDKAVELFTDGLKLNPSSALMYAKRGQAYLKLMKPNACIKDCTRALELNCDSAAAYKFRGRAYRLLADWEKAAADLRQACNIDFDEQTDEWLREVTPNASKLQQHKLKIERKRTEKEQHDKQERIRKAREANANAKAASAHPEPAAETGGAEDVNDFFNIMKDPEVMEAFQDPEISAAFQDISKNPANFLKHQSNPKVAAAINKLMGKFQGARGGFPGMPGGFPGMPGGFPGGMPGANVPTGPNGDDVGLD